MVQKTQNRLFEVVGRNKPTAKNANPQIFRMKIFAQNKPIATSRFWYFLAMLNKSKATTGEILQCEEILEHKKTQIKNYAITIRYNSRSGTHNMYREYRDVSLNGAVDQMYTEMASRHAARRPSIWILNAGVIKASQLRRENNKQFVDSGIKFRVNGRVPRNSSKAFRKVYSAVKPTPFY